MNKFGLIIFGFFTVFAFQNCQPAAFRAPSEKGGAANSSATSSSAPGTQYAWKFIPTRIRITSVLCLDPLVISTEDPSVGEPCDPSGGPGLRMGPNGRFINEVTRAEPASPYPGALTTQCYSGDIRTFTCELGPLKSVAE